MDIISFISKRFWVLGLLFVVLVALAALPLYASSYWVVRFTAILMYILLTASWATFSGPSGYMSLATAAFFGVGVYTSALLGKALPLQLVIVIGGLASFCLGLLVGALTLRLRGIYFAVFTFGLVLLIQRFLLWLEMTVMRTRGRILDPVADNTIYYIMLAIFVATLLTAWLIGRSKFGLALKSIGENEEAASHTGVNVTLVKIITFAISAVFMGAAGAIMAPKWVYIDPYIAFNVLLSFIPVLMAIFGGLGQLYGPIIGAALFAYLQQELQESEFSEYYLFIFGGILVVAIAFMPSGLVGLIQKLIQLIQKWRKGGTAEQNANT